MPERPLAAITGASAGIGAAFARRLASSGCDLLLIARREERLKALARELSDSFRVNTEPMVADLVLDADIDRVAARLREQKNLALLVNNAGFGTHGFFFDVDEEGQNRMHRLHVLATVRLTHAALQNLVPKGTGGVINVASVAGFGQSPNSVSYCATKAWMISFTQGLAIELSAKRSPVKVQALCPGFTLSEFHDILGVDRAAIPKSLWMPADFVVKESLDGFDRGKVLVIPGWRYRAISAFLRVLPGSLMRRIYARGAQRFRKPRVN